MKLLKYRKTAFILSVILTVIWMAYIFSFSAAPAPVSSEASSGIAEKVVRVYDKDYDVLPVGEQANVFSIVETAIRKAAHFFLYAVLGMLAALSCFLCKETDKLKYVIGFCICVLYGASDEIHQYFSPGRAALVKDVLIDGAGAMTGMILVLLVIWFLKEKTAKLSASETKQ